MRQPNLLKRKAMALPLTLVILLFGSVLVATAFYIVQNMYSTSRHSVTHTELYNAAQSGIEQGKSLIAKEYTNLDVNEKIYDGSLDSVRAKLSGSDLDQSLQDVSLTDPPGVVLNVDILDCNYTLPTGMSFATLTDDQRNELPPQWEGGSGSGGTFDFFEGTSMIMDPGRLIPVGGGGQRRYVIRSKASDGNQSVTIEVVVRVKEDE
ncbi:MAG: hypothetical protein ACP5CD_05550 [Thermovirgaceae bacterium]